MKVGPTLQLSPVTFCSDQNVLYLCCPIKHLWLLSTYQVASVTEELTFYFISMNLNINSYMWLMATVLYSIVPNGPIVMLVVL